MTARASVLVGFSILGACALFACRDIGAEAPPVNLDAGCGDAEVEEGVDIDALVDAQEAAADTVSVADADTEQEDGEAGTVAAALTGRSEDCLTCAEANCANYLHTCDRLPGRAAMGPGVGKRKSTLCVDTLACLLETECGKKDVTFCYCGLPSVTGTMDDCFNFPSSNSGVCKSSFEAAAEETMPEPLLASLTDTSKALGWAVLLDRCLYDNRCAACFSAE
jgi:hypothetical protein